MPDVFQHIVGLVAPHPILVGLLLVAAIVFFVFFLVPCWTLGRKLAHFSRMVSALRADTHPDPINIKPNDKRLSHLWNQYCSSLHMPEGAVNSRTGALVSAAYRATTPAEAIFNAQSIFEGRIHTEFFKHLPGLLTGLGIIGTFLGLIDGLERSSGAGNAVDTSVLIGSVKDAFHVSAFAITLAMIVTFFEKISVAGLHRSVEGLCQDIDVLFSTGVGEEYLARLVTASEESASQARILKDALVGELATILERLTERQIEASTRQQADLQTHLVHAIDHSLKQPLGKIADGFNSFSGSQGDKITQSLQDSMAAFAVKLEELAKELQKNTAQALETAILSFQSMAQQVANAGQSATSAISEQLATVVEQMASREALANQNSLAMTNDMRRTMSAAQAETSTGLAQTLDGLGRQMAEIVGAIQTQATATSARQQQKIEELAAQSAVQQEKTRQASEAAMVAFQAVAQQLGNAGQSATSVMSDQLNKVMAEMAARQEQMNDTMRRLVDELRGTVSQTQTETSGNVSRLLTDLGRQITELVGVLRDEAATSGVATREAMAAFAQQVAGQAQQLNTSTTGMIDTMGAAAASAHVQSTGAVGQMLQDLALQVRDVTGALQSEARASSAAHRDSVTGLAAGTSEVVAALADRVQQQSTAVDQAALAMRNAVAELGSSVNRNVKEMGEGARTMREAATQFTGSGNAISEVFDRSKAVSIELTHAATALAASSNSMQSVVADYQSARESFRGYVAELQAVVNRAKDEAGMTDELVSKLRDAAGHLKAAQGEADGYLIKINGALSGAHQQFGAQMLKVVGETNRDFHQHMTTTTGMLASAVEHLGNTLDEFDPNKGKR
jgi:uncharacterized protein YdhG (YjbR/CyaY superfamily)